MGVNAQGYIALTKAGRYQEALELVRRDNVLPGICGRVCTHPCESACRRSELDEPVAIRNLKRFSRISKSPLGMNRGSPSIPSVRRRSPSSVPALPDWPPGPTWPAWVTRSPSSRRRPWPGGLLRYGIGPHRLPRDILDYELDYIGKLGVRFETSHPIDLKRDLERLKEDFDAVIVATGTWADRTLGVVGEDLGGVEGCLSFLTRLYRGDIQTLQGKGCRHR